MLSLPLLFHACELTQIGHLSANYVSLCFNSSILMASIYSGRAEFGWLLGSIAVISLLVQGQTWPSGAAAVICLSSRCLRSLPFRLQYVECGLLIQIIYLAILDCYDKVLIVYCLRCFLLHIILIYKDIAQWRDQI